MRGPWFRRLPPFPGLTAPGLALLLACQEGATPTGPELGRGGKAAELTATPSALGFLLPDVSPATVTARVQYVGPITAATSDAQCATVAPHSLPATKPAGSSTYMATFSVTPVGAGTCTITLTDKQGKQAQVAVNVEAALTERMVFVSGESNQNEVFARDPDGTVGQLTVDFRATHPAVAPDGRIVMSVNKNPDHNDELYIMAADGSAPARLTFDEAHGPRDLEPAVSPDGQLIAFGRFVVTTTGFFQDICVLPVGGGDLVPLTGSDGLYRSPDYSPDGSRMVYSGLREDNADIYVMDADGSDQIRLTTDAASDVAPVFDPDGRIVFASDRNGSYDLYRMDADGSNVTRLTSDPGLELDPTFGDDGRLVFASDRDGDLEIYLMGANGVWHALTDNDVPDYAPAF